MRIINLALIMLIYGCSGLNATAARLPIKSAPIEAQDRSTGTVFRIKYKDSTYLVTAGHVCDNFETLTVQGHKVRVLMSRLDEVDLCIITDNPKVKLPTLKPLTDLNSTVGPIHTDAYHWEPSIKGFARDLHSGKILKPEPAYYHQREAKCDPTTFCISYMYIPLKIATDSYVFGGNSGGPVFDTTSDTVFGIIIMRNNMNEGAFTPLQFVLDAIDNKLMKPLPFEVEWDVFRQEGENFCKKNNILTKPLITRTGYKSFNVFCRK